MRTGKAESTNHRQIGRETVVQREGLEDLTLVVVKARLASQGLQREGKKEEGCMASVRRRTATRRSRTARVGAETAGAVLLKRAYEQPEAADGYRVLVDRLWPRGVRKDALAIDAWMKEIGPSDELRRSFGHDAARWEEFAARYREELRRQPASGLVDELVAQAKRGTLTLVYGAKDELHNQAVVLRERIEQRLHRARPRAPAAHVAAEAAPRARDRALAAPHPTSSRGRALGATKARASPARRTGPRVRSH
ncbi:DUF488 domain-containing protein [Sorangium sp. So ce204]|uniref:DUF488 domain-containing protein n=1 Tax=Sorangium sp. So ce204 TaxID=3133288 RepID=UPI003F60BA71